LENRGAKGERERERDYVDGNALKLSLFEMREPALLYNHF
jgi:hypothetical protein